MRAERRAGEIFGTGSHFAGTCAKSLRMIYRIARHALLVAIAASLIGAGTSPVRAADAAFRAWLDALWPAAQALGVSRQTFDMATRGLEPDLSLPDLELPGQGP